MPHRERYIFVCTNRREEGNPKGSCAQKGSEEIVTRLKAALLARGLAKSVRACSSSCLDLCEIGATVVVEPDHVVYGRVSVEDVDDIADAVQTGTVVTRLVVAPPQSGGHVIGLGFELSESLSGSYYLLDEPLRDHAIRISLRLAVSGMRRFLRERKVEAVGTIFAEHLAERAPEGVRLSGTLTMKLFEEKRIPYDLSFSGDDGRLYRLRGQRDFFMHDAIDSLTILPASLYDAAGVETGRVVLRFDPKTELPLLVKSFRPRLRGNSSATNRVAASKRMSMDRLLPVSTALLVVDVQEKLAAAMPEATMNALVKNAGILLETARALGVHVIASEQYPKGLGPTVPGLADALAVMGVTPMPKMAFDACSELAVARALAAAGARSVVVVGMETHVCVFQTARELVKRGYATYVVADAVASRSEDNRRIGLSLCEKAGAVVTTTETVAFDWLERAGTDPFKAVSKLLR